MSTRAEPLTKLQSGKENPIQRCAADPPETLKSKLEMVARAYDPCISCSVHLINIK